MWSRILCITQPLCLQLVSLRRMTILAVVLLAAVLIASICSATPVHMLPYSLTCSLAGAVFCPPIAAMPPISLYTAPDVFLAHTFLYCVSWVICTLPLLFLYPIFCMTGCMWCSHYLLHVCLPHAQLPPYLVCQYSCFLCLLLCALFYVIYFCTLLVLCLLRACYLELASCISPLFLCPATASVICTT